MNNNNNYPRKENNKEKLTEGLGGKNDHMMDHHDSEYEYSKKGNSNISNPSLIVSQKAKNMQNSKQEQVNKTLMSQQKKLKDKILGVKERQSLMNKNSEVSSNNLLKSKQEPLTQKQIKYLKDYFRYSCQKQSNSPKYSTFDKVKVLLQTMSLTEWMRLCKNLGVFDFFVESRDFVRTLNSMFKRYENKEKMLDFEGFCEAFQVLMQTMHKYKQENEPKNRISIKKYLGLTSEEDHMAKLCGMGINCTVGKQKNNRNYENDQSQNIISRKSFNRNLASLSTKLPLSRKGKQNETNFQSTGKKPPKIYRKRQDRIRSRLLGNLDVSNLSKFSPGQQMRENFENIAEDSDKFLKDYLSKKKDIKEGVLKRLQNQSTKYSRVILVQK